MTPVRYGRRVIDEKRRYCRWIDPRVWALPVGAVVAYLRGRGWKERESDRPHFLVFEEPQAPLGEDPCYQFVPTFEHEPGYGQQMFELLTGVAEFEERQASEVIDDILKQADQQQANGVAAGQAQNTGTGS